MNKFKEGDRVAFYTGSGRHVGTVLNPVGDMVGVTTKGNVLYSVHYQQCRRLKKKEPMRIYFAKHGNGLAFSNIFASLNDIWNKIKDGERIDFVEVRKKK